MGVCCAGIPLELCNCLWLLWTREGWPREWDGDLEAPRQSTAFSTLISTIRGWADPQNPVF